MTAFLIIQGFFNTEVPKVMYRKTEKQKNRKAEKQKKQKNRKTEKQKNRKNRKTEKTYSELII